MLQPVGSVHKRGRKCHDNDTLNMLSHMHEDFSTHGMLEVHKKSTRQDISLGQRKRRVVSPNALGSVRLHNKDFNEQKYGASNSSESALEKNMPFSSSNSFTQKASQMESEVSTQKVERCSALEGNVGADESNTAEASNGHKELDTGNEALIGQRIKVWSTFDNCFYSGTVDDFNPENNTHKITCDSGEVEILCLDSESWETISDCSLTEREVQPSDEPNTLHLRQCGKETVVKLRNDSRKQCKAKSNVEDGKVQCRGLPPLPQPTIPTVLKPGSLPPLPSILNLPSAPKRKGIERMMVEIVGIKGKLGRVTFGALDKLGMLGSRGSEPGFNTVGIVG
ncbi:hypothetical protein V6N11_039297 [Hibiscus sabdariffa]|uniref:Tudor domain-containing protein n=1 Tax=Hibiscus sabdariffa TaxID=183260 RepID=A0ABR2SMU3_9ROSI